MRWQQKVIVAVICFVGGVGLCAISFTVRNENIRLYVWSGLFLLIVSGVLLRNGLRSRPAKRVNDWYDTTNKYHTRTFPHEGRLSSLPSDWQRELAALWRLQADVNNGGYLQFLGNWGRESYVHASEALRKIGATRTADIVDGCQALVDEHFGVEERSPDDLRQLLPNPIIGCDGTLIKDVGSALPDAVLARIYELSFEFMQCPDDLADLGLRYYRSYIAS